MKKILLAAVAALALGIGSTAYAAEGEGDGESAVTAEWLAENGVRQEPADQWFAEQNHQAPQVQQPTMTQGQVTTYQQPGDNS